MTDKQEIDAAAERIMTAHGTAVDAHLHGGVMDICRTADKLRAAIRAELAAAGAQAVLEGWQLVPKSATEEMFIELDTNKFGRRMDFDPGNLISIWNRVLDAAPPSKDAVPVAWQDVIAERERQVSAEGWTPEHDDEHDGGDMAAAASAYALAACDRLNPYSQGDGGFDAELTGGVSEPPMMWPTEWQWKPADPRRMLVKAGALILAEIERLDRAAPPSKDAEQAAQQEKP